MRINQVLWILSNETRNIIPVVIVEKITKETATGQKIEFIIESTSGKRRNLSDVRDKYFESSEEARDHLLQLLAVMVDEIVNKAVVLSQKFEHLHHDLQKTVHLDQERDTMDQQGHDTVILPDGRTAKINFKMPEA